MPDTKSPFQSLTINASLIALVVQLLALFGIQIAPETAADIGASLNSIITGVMLLLAIYGRLKAKKQITIAAPDKVACAPATVGVVLVVALLLAGCATTGGTTATPAPPLSAIRLTADRALALADVASAGVEAATEAAIADGRITGTAAIAARERADRVRSALLIARGVAIVWGAPSAQDRAAAVLDLAVAAQAFFPGSASPAAPQ